MPRRRSLSHAQLAAAALAVIDRDGLALMSMRTVAKELGMSTMALYRYVDDRAELERLVVELVLDGLDTSAPPADRPCRDRIETMALRMRDTLAAHPDVVPLTAVHRLSSPSLLRWAETVLAILTETGLTGPRRVIALRGLTASVFGALQFARLGPLSSEGTDQLAALRSEEVPYLSETARHARTVTDDAEFRGGLALLLAGLTDAAPGEGSP